MKSNHHILFIVLVLVLVTLITPHAVFAATSTQASPTAAELRAELDQISIQLATSTIGTATVVLSPGGSTLQASTTASGGLLELTLPHFEHTNPDQSAKVIQPVIPMARITLQYMPCVAAAPSVCVPTASTSYPLMTSDLASGQTTGYLHYLVTLTNLSTSTATLQITDSTFLSEIQAKLDVIALQVHALLGT